MAKFQSTQATIENVRKQRKLEQELTDIQKQWYLQLKYITRERLEVTKQWCHLVKAKREANHFDGRLRGPNLRRYIDGCQHKMQAEKENKLSDKFDFTVDPVERMSIHLPPIRGATQGGASSSSSPTEPAVSLSSRDLERMRHGLLRAVSDSQLVHLRRLERMERRKQRRERKSKEKVPFQNSAPLPTAGRWLPAIPGAAAAAPGHTAAAGADPSGDPFPVGGAMSRQKSMSLNHLPVIKERYGLTEDGRPRDAAVSRRVKAVDAPF